MASRAEVRSFIDKLRPLLERAQADGVLARMKLDVRDRFEESIAEEDEAQRAKSISIFAEELEAFCTDLRLAVVTVQQQVERTARRWGRGWLCGLLFAAVLVVLGFAVTGGGSPGAGAFLVFLCAPIALVVGIVWGSTPEEIRPIRHGS